MILRIYTIIHTLISLVGIFTGFAGLLGLLIVGIIRFRVDPPPRAAIG